jgi:hypothetical protein
MTSGTSHRCLRARRWIADPAGAGRVPVVSVVAPEGEG